MRNYYKYFDEDTSKIISEVMVNYSGNRSFTGGFDDNFGNSPSVSSHYDKIERNKKRIEKIKNFRHDAMLGKFKWGQEFYWDWADMMKLGDHEVRWDLMCILLEFSQWHSENLKILTNLSVVEDICLQELLDYCKKEFSFIWKQNSYWKKDGKMIKNTISKILNRHNFLNACGTDLLDFKESFLMEYRKKMDISKFFKKEDVVYENSINWVKPRA